ncbi:hypothetical protein GF374_02865 [Candidatus Woesearchaeota archaeon]|nr:hypothetical protein [Candidatus Woesearchaeota archaeon]
MELIFGKKKKKKKRKRRSRTKTKQKQKTKKKTKRDHITLREWKKELKRVQEHPLTQAKIINQNMLSSIMDLLEQIDEKLNKLNTRMDRLEAKKVSDKTKKELRAQLSKQEQKIIDFIKTNNLVQAGPLSEELGISRSNASLKLNKLYSIGYLNKQKDGKATHFSYKK